MKQFFDVPTQVHFQVENEWCYGIAYYNIIICACCGGIFEVDEITNITELPWINFTEEIMDYNLPFGEVEEE